MRPAASRKSRFSSSVSRGKASDDSRECVLALPDNVIRLCSLGLYNVKVKIMLL